MKIKNLGGAKNMRSKLGKAPVILSISRVIPSITTKCDFRIP